MDGAMSDSTAASFAQPMTWEEAFNFAHEEGVAAFTALMHGDTDTARALLDSARAANALARELHDRMFR
jgi:hypothetical protein